MSPLFILIGAIPAPPKGRPYTIAGLLILVLGTCTLFIAGSTGHAASELAERGGAVDAVLETHEDMAAEAQIVFAGLSAILLGILVVSRFLHRGDSRLFSTLLPLAFLLLYSAGALFLVNTAHAGGRLVHEFGVHAIVPATSEQSPSPPQSERSDVQVPR